MGADDDGVAALQCEHGVAHGGNDGVGGGGNGTDHAHGLGDQYKALLGQTVDDADALLALQLVPDDAGLALVLLDLVLIDAHAGLIYGHAGQRLGIVKDGFCHGAAGCVYLFLGVLFEFFLGNACACNQLFYMQFSIHKSQTSNF